MIGINREAEYYSPNRTLSRIGKRIMMDFGLAGLFDRFERDFGKRFTFFLEAVIAFAILSVCFGLIWAFIAPVFVFIKNGFSNVYDGVATLGPSQIGDVTIRGIELFQFGLLILSMVATMTSALWLIRGRRRTHAQNIWLRKKVMHLNDLISDADRESQSRANTEEEKPQ